MPISFYYYKNERVIKMKYVETRTVEEYDLENGLSIYIRTRHKPDSVRCDLSFFERYVEKPELHVYSELIKGKNPISAMMEIYRILSDEDWCLELWTKSESLIKKEDATK